MYNIYIYIYTMFVAAGPAPVLPQEAAVVEGEGLVVR